MTKEEEKIIVNNLIKLMRFEKFSERVGDDHVYDGIVYAGWLNAKARTTIPNEMIDDVDYVNRSKEILAQTILAHLFEGIRFKNEIGGVKYLGFDDSRVDRFECLKCKSPDVESGANYCCACGIKLNWNG